MSHEVKYKYPLGLDFTPQSELHERIKNKILEFADESFSYMSRRYSTWRQIDDSLRAFVDLTDEEKDVVKRDSRKPVAIVVPLSYAVLETLLTYMTAKFLQSPIFLYEGFDPDDTVKAALLELVIDRQARKAKMGLDLHTMWRDGFSYGIGAVAVSWRRDVTTQTFRRKTILGVKNYVEEVVDYEGNELIPIDVYDLLPDPTVPIHKVQSMSYIGWFDQETYENLLREEQNDPNIFNVRYLKDSKRSFSRFGARRYTNDYSPLTQSTNKINLIVMYVDLIPSDYGLGDSDYPEKWRFVLANEEVIISAQPMNLNHNRFPVVIAAPDFDGHSLTPISRLEIINGLQKTIDWLFTSHIENVRKAINDMIVVDPMLVNINDLTDPRPGKIIRLRRAAWGRGVEGAIKQLNVVDVTQNHINDASFILDITQRVTSATDILQGIIRSSGERRSATEAREAVNAALSRLQKTAVLVSLQSMQDIGYMLAANTIQLMSEDVYVRIAGRYKEMLAQQFGQPFVKVSPFDLDVRFDVVVKDGTEQGSENADLWIQLYQVIAQNPDIAKQFDMVRIFQHIATLLGAKNIDDFKVSVIPDEQIERGAEAGNFAPIEELLGGELNGQQEA